MRREHRTNVAWLICVLGAMESVAVFGLALIAGPRLLYLVGWTALAVSAMAGATLARLVYLGHRSDPPVETPI